MFCYSEINSMEVTGNCKKERWIRMFADDEHALNGTAPYATEMNATWLSHKERVQVISMERDHEAGNKVTHFIALTALGANVRIARSDILLDKEEAMIRELVHLLSGDSRSEKFKRYFVIMRQFMDDGVPYAGSLRMHLNERPRQQSFDLNDAS